MAFSNRSHASNSVCVLEAHPVLAVVGGVSRTAGREGAAAPTRSGPSGAVVEGRTRMERACGSGPGADTHGSSPFQGEMVGPFSLPDKG